MADSPWPIEIDLREVAPEAARCGACLDSRKAWVCLGKGANEDRYGKPVPCPACSGTGVCPRCLTVLPAQRVAS
jgi:DnaJ-class molecular chaperone